MQAKMVIDLEVSWIVSARCSLPNAVLTKRKTTQVMVPFLTENTTAFIFGKLSANTHLLINSTNASFCVQQMKTKHAKNNIEDAKYSYVVLRRGKRPLPSSSTTASSEASTSGMELEAYRWPRLVLPPRKNPRHVVLDVCSKTGISYPV